MATKKSKEYISFRCVTCGECCKGFGGIFITAEEQARIARHLGLSEDDFFKKYCERLNKKISIKIGPNGYCIFWKDKLCGVHEVKPTPCRLWPFFENIVAIEDNWKIAKNNCPGFLPDSTYEEFLEDARSFKSEDEK